MHHDDGIQVVSLGGRRALVVRCDEAGRCDDTSVAEALRSHDAELVWLSADGTAPAEEVVRRIDPTVVAATLTPVVDAVKEVDGDEIVRTVDRSTLSTVIPPALLPRSIVERVLAHGVAGSLLAHAARTSTVVALRPGG